MFFMRYIMLKKLLGCHTKIKIKIALGEKKRGEILFSQEQSAPPSKCKCKFDAIKCHAAIKYSACNSPRPRKIRAAPYRSFVY